MIMSVPKLVPISKLRLTQNEVLSVLGQSPVVLTQHGEAVAVLVDPGMWNDLLRELEVWQDSFDALEEKYLLAIGEEEVIDWEKAKAERDAVSA